MKMKNKTYDILVWVAMIVLPAVGTLYASLASIWSLPYAEAIPATILAIDTFLGAILKISNNQYNKTEEE